MILRQKIEARKNWIWQLVKVTARFAQIGTLAIHWLTAYSMASIDEHSSSGRFLGGNFTWSLAA
jgi:hypothetical protein